MAKNAPVVKECVTIPLGDLGDEPGLWRNVDDKVVDSYIEMIHKGDYGLNILGRPQILDVDGEKLKDGDGKFQLVDGRKIRRALTSTKAEYDSAKQNNEQLPWANAQLTHIYEHGLMVDVVTFKDDNKAIIKAWYAFAHDKDSVKFQHTSLLQKWEVFCFDPPTQ